jgi:flagellar FliJ protein
MKRFAFRLQPVLNLKNHQENMAKMAVARVMQALFECEKKIEVLKKDLNSALRDFDARTQIGIRAEELTFFTNYLTRIDRLVAHEENRERLIRKQLEEKQRLLKEKIIEKKTLETLKEKKKEAYYQEVEKMIQKESDDMTAIRRKEELPDGD